MGGNVLKTKIKLLLIRLQIEFRKPTYSGKAFCIGYNKTGTTSCGKAFEILGYRNLSFNRRIMREYENRHLSRVLKCASKFDSFDDIPWLKEEMIPLLDKNFPNSKFVYLERDEESWKKSLSSWTYKITGKYPNIEKETENYRNHRKFVLEYFKNRTNDFLILNVSDEDAFAKLAKFLGKETSIKQMPHLNKT
jgi:hypothetical protein